MDVPTPISESVTPWWNAGWTTGALSLLVILLAALLLWPTASALAGAFGTVAGVLVENGRVGWGILWLVLALMNIGEVVGALALS